MSDKRQMLPDNPTVTDLHAVIGELQDQLAMMHEECDEHEENDGNIIMELRAEVERLEAEVVAEHELNRRAMAEIERLKLQTNWADIDQLRAENERLRAWQHEAEELIGHQLRKIERLRAALEKIAKAGNVHSGWFVQIATDALGAFD